MIEPFAVAGGTMCDPFAGSGALVRAAAAAGMDAIGIENNPLDARAA
jgi:DNA modification methylase